MLNKAVDCINSFKMRDHPFIHYVNDSPTVPNEVAKKLKSLAKKTYTPIDFTGSRADYGASRLFIKEDSDVDNGIKQFALTLDSLEFRIKLQEKFNTSLLKASLRLELVTDVNGFWQVPHTDVKDKKITWLTYLSTVEECGEVGTSLANTDKEFVGSAIFGFNKGLIFIPSDNTWHGFRK